MINIIRGTDLPMELVLKDANGLPMDINSLDDIQILVYQKKEDVIQSWTLNGGIEVVNALAGQVRIILDRSNTLGLPEKGVFMEVIYTAADALGEEGIVKIACSPKLIANVVNSAAND